MRRATRSGHDEMPPDRNGAGLAALVAGFVAVACAFVPAFGELIAAPAAVAAIVLGLIGLRRAEDRVASNRSEALVGFVLGLIAVLILSTVFFATLA